MYSVFHFVCIYNIISNRVEWLEIKQLYKKMQKDRMKIVKENNKKVIVKPQTDMTQFVSDCLIKVSCHKTDDKEPVTGDSQPVTEDSQPVTGDSQPVTGDNEPVTVDSLEVVDKIHVKLTPHNIIVYFRHSVLNMVR